MESQAPPGFNWFPGKQPFSRMKPLLRTHFEGGKDKEPVDPRVPYLADRTKCGPWFIAFGRLKFIHLADPGRSDLLPLIF